MEIGNTDFIYKNKLDKACLWRQEIQILFTNNELDKACFQHDMGYGKNFER